MVGLEVVGRTSAVVEAEIDDCHPWEEEDRRTGGNLDAYQQMVVILILL